MSWSSIKFANIIDWKSDNWFDNREQSENLINKQQENIPVNSERSSEWEQKGKQSKSDDNELEGNCKSIESFQSISYIIH